MNNVKYYIFLQLFFSLSFCYDPLERVKYNFDLFCSEFYQNIPNNFDPSHFTVNSKNFKKLFYNYNLDVIGSVDNPQLISSAFINSHSDSLLLVFEPIIVNKDISKKTLSSDYSRYGLSGRIESAYLRYNFTRLNINFGRFALWWGESVLGSLIQSGHAPSYEVLLVKQKFHNFSFETLYGQLTPIVDNLNQRILRNISGHKLNYFNGKNFSFSIGEQIIYTGEKRGVELVYLNPFVPYFFTSIEGTELENGYDNDNSMIFMDFRFKYHNERSIFSEILIDDFQLDKTNKDHALGWKCGIDGFEKILGYPIYWVAEYTNVNQWTYLHPGQNTSWENKGRPIGFKYGPDSKLFELLFHIKIKSHYSILVNCGSLNKGINNINSFWRNGDSSFINERKYINYFDIGLIYGNERGVLEVGYTSKDFDLNYLSSWNEFDQIKKFYIKLKFNYIGSIDIFNTN